MSAVRAIRILLRCNISPADPERGWSHSTENGGDMRSRKLRKLSTKKLSMGRIAIPAWLIGMFALLVIAVAAGQAVGPVLSGSVQGSVGVTAQQGLILNATSSTHAVEFAAGHADDALITVSDEGAAFTAAIEMHIGDTATIKLDIDNSSDASTNAVLELNVPRGIDADVEEDSDASGISEARLTRGSWLMKINSGATGHLNVALSPKDDLAPGFYTVTGRLVQVAN